MTRVKGRKVSGVGKLIVITGRSGSGKDSVLDRLLLNPQVVEKGFKKLVTHATRPIRPGEVEGSSYYFISEEEIFDMHRNGKLVEPPTKTGDSYKGTSKDEVLRVIKEGAHLLWRIDLSRAAEVASGRFFIDTFDPETGKILAKCTEVIFLESDEETLALRRKKRDKNMYDPKQYELRDKQDRKVLEKFGREFRLKVPNKQDRLGIAVRRVVRYLVDGKN